MGLERVQGVAWWVGLGGLALGTLASVGLALPLTLSPQHVAWWSLLAGVCGVSCGLALRRRLWSIERERWQWAEEAGASRAERELAHREAEQARRAAGLAWVLAPLGLAYWICWQCEPALAFSQAGLLLTAPLLGVSIGYVLGGRREASDGGSA